MIHREDILEYNAETVDFSKRGVSEWSLPAEATVPGDPWAPSAPTISAAAADQAIDLTLTRPATNVDGTTCTDFKEFKIYYSASSGIDTSNPSTYDGTFYTQATSHTYPTSATTYFVATAIDKNGNESSASSEVNATPTSSGYSPSIDDYTNNIANVYAGDGMLGIEFQPPKSTWVRWAGWKLYYDVNTGAGWSGSWTAIYIGSGPGFLHKGLTTTYAYKYKLTALGEDGSETTGTISDNSGAGYTPNATDNSAVVAVTIFAENVVATNEVRAAHIKAGTITGDKISSATTITAGSGDNVGVLDGADATWRIYAGSATPSSAPFRVDQTGVLYASGATISGTITIGGGSSGISNLSDAGALAVRDTTSLVNNYSISGVIDGWSPTEEGIVNATKDGVTVKVHEVTTDGDVMVFSDYAQIDPTQIYKVTLSIYSDDGTTGTRYFGMYAYDADKTRLDVTPFVVSSRSWGTAGWNAYFWSGDVPAGTWRDMVAYILPATIEDKDIPDGQNVIQHFKVPANTKYVRIRYLNYYNDGTSVTNYFYSPSLVAVDTYIPSGWRHSSDTTYIDGGHIYTGTITADKINVTSLSAISADLGTITAGSITGGTISADTITTGTLDFSSISRAGLAVLNSELNGGITYDKISSVDAATITVGTLSADRIAANSITVAKMYIDADVDFQATGTRQGIKGLQDIYFDSGKSQNYPYIQLNAGNIALWEWSGGSHIGIDANVQITATGHVELIGDYVTGVFKYQGATVFGPATCPTAWTDLNLSSYVGAQRALVLLRIQGNGSDYNTYRFRPNGWSVEQPAAATNHPGAFSCRVGSAYPYNYVWAMTGTDGIVEWAGYSAITTTVFLIASLR